MSFSSLDSLQKPYEFLYAKKSKKLICRYPCFLFFYLKLDEKSGKKSRILFKNSSNEQQHKVSISFSLA